ncbi:MAG: hypothetical protein ACTJHU_01425 [Mycetocola sp.]
MSRHVFDTTELQTLLSSLNDYVSYLDGFTSDAAGVAYGASSQWSGGASSAFMANFQTWAGGAAQMAAGAAELRDWLAEVIATYDGAGEQLEQVFEG